MILNIVILILLIVGVSNRIIRYMKIRHYLNNIFYVCNLISLIDYKTDKISKDVEFIKTTTKFK